MNNVTIVHLTTINQHTRDSSDQSTTRAQKQFLGAPRSSRRRTSHPAGNVHGQAYILLKCFTGRFATPVSCRFATAILGAAVNTAVLATTVVTLLAVATALAATTNSTSGDFETAELLREIVVDVVVLATPQP